VLSGQLRGIERKGEKVALKTPSGENRKDECK
jgi:hypothetical protein